VPAARDRVGPRDRKCVQQIMARRPTMHTDCNVKHNQNPNLQQQEGHHSVDRPLHVKIRKQKDKYARDQCEGDPASGERNM
jgi:hypothetical protein